MTLSVIIVSYNVSSFLIQCLNSLFAGTDQNQFEVIVVDNHSFDQTPVRIKKLFPQIKLLQNDRNLGFAGAVNKGLKQAAGDFVCLLNPDTLVKTDTMAILRQYLEDHPECGVVGCKVLDADGTMQLASRRSFPRPKVAVPKLLGLTRLFPKHPWFGQYNMTHQDPDIIQEVDAVSGSCMMIPRRIFDEIGAFDERFFMYFEDTDFCFRVQKAGYRVVYNPNTQIIHYKGESLKRAPFNTIEVFHQAMEQFFRKHRREFPLWPLTRLFIKLAIGVRKMQAYLLKHRAFFVSSVLDYGAILSSFAVSIIIWYPFHYGTSATLDLMLHHWELVVTYLLVWTVTAGWAQLYPTHVLSYGRSIFCSVLTFILTATATYFVSFFAHSRAVLMMTAGFSIFFSSGWRILIHILYRLGLVQVTHIAPLFTRRILLVGAEQETERTADTLSNLPNSDINLVGVVDDTAPETSNDSIPFLGFVEDLPGIIRTHRVNEVLFQDNDFSIDRVIDIIQKAGNSNVAFKFVSDGQKQIIGKGVIENLGGVPLVDMEFPLYDSLHMAVKRAFDIVGSLLVMVISLPVQIILLIAGKARQRIVWGPGGKTVTFWEFQSRRSWIRCLPSYLSVILGQMSIVGSSMVDNHHPDPEILFKPGITGLSQLKSGTIRKDTARSFDRFYIQNHSIVFDIEIILKTLLRI